MSASDWPESDGTGFLYHYTSQMNAARIMEDEPPYARAGYTSHFGFGFYATDIEPIDEECIDYVNEECFNGDRRAAELNHVLVLLREDGRERFEQVAPSQWLIDRRSPEDRIELELLLVSVLRWDGKAWVQVAKWNGWDWEHPDGPRH